MNKTILLAVLIVFSLISTPSMGQDTGLADSEYKEIQDTVIFPFFKALKKGDVNEIKRHLSSDTYNEYKRLLEENKEYPKFLRDYYKDAKFSVVRASSEVDDEIEFKVFVEFPNGSEIVNQYKVAKEMNVNGAMRGQKKWRITKAFSNKEQRASE